MKRAGVVDAELRDDVVLDRRRGGGGERENGTRRTVAQRRQILSEHAVVGAKVVAPLRDAVGLVDGDERGLAAWRASRGSRERAGARAR